MLTLVLDWYGTAWVATSWHEIVSHIPMCANLCRDGTKFSLVWYRLAPLDYAHEWLVSADKSGPAFAERCEQKERDVMTCCGRGGGKTGLVWYV